MKKIGKKHFIVEESIFHRQVHIFLNYTHKEFAKWTGDKEYQKKSDEKEWDDNFVGFSVDTQKDGKPVEWVICLKHFDWTIIDQGTLIHEIVHTVIKIWKLNNIPFNEDTQEFLAHSISNLYEDIAIKLVKK